MKKITVFSLGKEPPDTWHVEVDGLGEVRICNGAYERDMFIAELKYRILKIDE